MADHRSQDGEPFDDEEPLDDRHPVPNGSNHSIPDGTEPVDAVAAIWQLTVRKDVPGWRYLVGAALIRSLGQDGQSRHPYRNAGIALAAAVAVALAKHRGIIP